MSELFMQLRALQIASRSIEAQIVEMLGEADEPMALSDLHVRLSGRLVAREVLGDTLRAMAALGQIEKIDGRVPSGNSAVRYCLPGRGERGPAASRPRQANPDANISRVLSAVEAAGADGLVRRALCSRLADLSDGQIDSALCYLVKSRRVHRVGRSIVAGPPADVQQAA